MANGYVPSVSSSGPLKILNSTKITSVDPDLSFQKIFDETMNKPAKNVSAKADVVPQTNLMASVNGLAGKVSHEQAHQLIAQAYAQQESDSVDPSKRRARSKAETLTPKNVNIEGLRSNKFETTPFQVLIDKSIDALEGLSNMEYRVNDLIEQFIQGKASIDEVSMETAKLNLAVSFATTVITTATATFKEIQQTPI
ncbi:hypothetical protein HOH45_06405 [bacterium]|jgi:hypothetical protein|nr:hypothetical protein [bacterium]